MTEDYLKGWNDAIAACKEAQPCTAEKPDESAYTKGHFDGVMDYGRAIRAVRPQEKPRGVPWTAYEWSA